MATVDEPTTPPTTGASETSADGNQQDEPLPPQQPASSGDSNQLDQSAETDDGDTSQEEKLPVSPQTHSADSMNNQGDKTLENSSDKITENAPASSQKNSAISKQGDENSEDKSQLEKTPAEPPTNFADSNQGDENSRDKSQLEKTRASSPLARSPDEPDTDLASSPQAVSGDSNDKNKPRPPPSQTESGETSPSQLDAAPLASLQAVSGDSNVVDDPRSPPPQTADSGEVSQPVNRSASPSQEQTAHATNQSSPTSQPQASAERNEAVSAPPSSLTQASGDHKPLHDPLVSAEEHSDENNMNGTSSSADSSRTIQPPPSSGIAGDENKINGTTAPAVDSSRAIPLSEAFPLSSGTAGDDTVNGITSPASLPVDSSRTIQQHTSGTPAQLPGTSPDRNQLGSPPPPGPLSASASGVTNPLGSSLPYQCSLCQGPYTEPKFLPCHHSFCAPCLEGVVRKTQKSSLLCPSCSLSISLPPGGVAELPANQYVSQTCKKGLGSTACKVHVDEKLKLYCVQCDQAICTCCKLTNHEAHVTRDLHVTAEEKKKEVKERKEQLMSAVEFAKERLRDAKEQRKILGVRRVEVEREIHNRHAHLIGHVNQAKAAAFNSLRAVTDKSEAEADDVVRQQEESLKELTDLQHSLERALVNGTGSDVIDMARALRGSNLQESLTLTQFASGNFTMRCPVFHVHVGESAIQRSMRQWMGSISDVPLGLHEAEMTLDSWFGYGVDKNVSVFSLCHVDTDPPCIIVSFETRNPNKQSSKSMVPPVVRFSEKGKSQGSTEYDGRVSCRRFSQGRSFNVACPRSHPQTLTKSLTVSNDVSSARGISSQLSLSDASAVNGSATAQPFLRQASMPEVSAGASSSGVRPLPAGASTSGASPSGVQTIPAEIASASPVNAANQASSSVRALPSGSLTTPQVVELVIESSAPPPQQQRGRIQSAHDVGAFFQTSSLPLTSVQYRVDSVFSSRAEIYSVHVLSADPFKTKENLEFSLNVGAHRAADVDDTGTIFVVLEEPQGMDTRRKVRMFRRPEQTPSPASTSTGLFRRVKSSKSSAVEAVSTYVPPNSSCQPSDVCFYRLGGQQVLLVADEGGDSIHVVGVDSDRLTFLRYLTSDCTLLVQPTAFNLDVLGRLWVACRGENVILCLQPGTRRSPVKPLDPDIQVV